MLGNAPPRLPGSPSPGSPRAPAAPRRAAGSPGLCLADQLCTWPGQLYQDLQSLLHDLNVVGQIAQLVGDLRGNYQVPAAALGLESSARTVLLGLTAVGPRGCREVSRWGGIPRSRSGGQHLGLIPALQTRVHSSRRRSAERLTPGTRRMSRAPEAFLSQPCLPPWAGPSPNTGPPGRT